MLQKVSDILDSNQEKSENWGGKREGSGRPKGPLPPERLEALAVKREFQQRVMHVADNLFNSQYNLARGEQYLMVKYETGSGKNKKTVIEVVDSPETIKAYLNGELENEDEYYYISTKPAVGMAIDSMLDRAFGKSVQETAIKHSNDPDNPLTNPAEQSSVETFIDYLKHDTSHNAKPD